MASILFHGKALTLYNVAKYILEYDKLGPKHKEWCDRYEEIKKSGRQRILLMKPRGTYKTTIYSVSNIIDILMDDWVRTGGTFDKRILLTSSTEDMAVQILSEVRQHLKNSPNLKDFFGYDPVESYNQREIQLFPRSVHKEPSIKAKGAMSAIVSEHYDVIIVDDLCNNDDRESFAVRERKKRWFIDLISILNPTGLLLVVGTRWHLDDVYQYILTNNPNLPAKDQYHIEIESIYDKDTGEPLFPSIYDRSDVERLKVEKGLVEFYSQYMNDPLPAETQLFKLEEFKFYTDYDKDFEDAKHVIYVDPALGRELDYSVIIVGAIKDNTFYFRDVYASNIITPDKLITQIEFFFNRYNAHIVGIEANQFQTLFAQSVKRRGIPVHEVKNFKKKQLRIEGLAPYVTSGVVRFRDDWMQRKDYQEVVEQLIKYPVHKHDDGPDALEGAVRIGLRNRALYNTLSGLLLGAKRK
jgi:predicted phage terminase large subunit-like protein